MLGEYNEMKKEKKSSHFSIKYYVKTTAAYCVSCKKILQMNIEGLEELNKID